MLNPSPDSDAVKSAADASAAGLDGSGLRIAIVSDAAPERNGVGAYYRDLAEHLKAVGARVDLISPRFRAGHWYGGLPLPLPGDPTQRFVLPSVPLVMRRMGRLRPDVVIVPTPGPFGMLGLVLAKRWHARLVVGFHTHFERLAELNDDWVLRGKVAQAYLNTCNRALFHEGSLVLANSDEMLDIARGIGAKRVGLMGTPIPKAFLDTPPQPLGAGVRRVLFAGRLAPEKNLGAVVDAAAALPDMQFQVAGDGPLRQWLLEQAEDLPNLHYVGWVKRQQIMPLIDGADALVLPSTVESFGTIALEAMARARLVVVSSQCGILSWETLKRGLFQIHANETLGDTLARVRALDHAILERKADIAREAARELNDRNLRHWLHVLRDPDPAGTDDVSV
ncbi:glycosyltransferase [uncultured Thiohalocapsa sp.]|uniref:glycosyltransferase n=1 Tax=uncultured Thiohalocapsa sp. TaxID=768990 RepID=UPI0025EDFB49|nr:glycosyltransferase [uncultured Thiohalocapsa sp.]